MVFAKQNWKKETKEQIPVHDNKRKELFYSIDITLVMITMVKCGALGPGTRGVRCVQMCQSSYRSVV